MCSHLNGVPPRKTLAAMNTALKRWILGTEGDVCTQRDK